MTAEVAILNKLAVSLAADSAVTTGFPGRERIFTSANKIFTLSKYAPVGVMIYGHVEHCSVPWEMIIKEFRKELGSKKYGRIGEYSDAFNKFYSQAKFVTETTQQVTVLGAAVSAYQTLRAEIQDNKKNFVAKEIEKAYDRMENILETYKDLNCFGDLSKRKFMIKYNNVFSSLFDQNEAFHIDLPAAVRTRFKELVYLILRSSMPSKFATGLVITGFGEDEIFPSLKEEQVDGAIFDCCRIISGDYIDIDRRRETVYVKAFAQDDVVNSFLHGVDDRYKQYLFRMLNVFMGDFLNEILKDHTSYDEEEKNVVRTLVRSRVKDSIDGFKSKMSNFCSNNYIMPVEDVLRSAPKDELAHVAEALVSLTSLKRKVAGDKETVGGPVDVAVISKGDGFVWIKRKHYFKPEMNHHFSRNYFNEGGDHGPAATKESSHKSGARAKSFSNGSATYASASSSHLVSKKRGSAS